MKVWIKIGVIFLAAALLTGCNTNRRQDSQTAYGDEALDLPGDEAGSEVVQDYSGVTELPAVATEVDGAAAGDGGTIAYTVQSGDTLMKIAYEHYGDLNAWKRVYLENKSRIRDPNALIKGTQLYLAQSDSAPGERRGEKYRIMVGDTLGKISDNVYGTIKKWKRLWENNRPMIKDPNKIYAGFTLYYLMTDEDRMELERIRNQPLPLTQEPNAPAAPSVPVAPAPPKTETARAPSSTTGLPGAAMPAPAGLPTAVPIAPLPAPAGR